MLMCCYEPIHWLTDSCYGVCRASECVANCMSFMRRKNSTIMLYETECMWFTPKSKRTAGKDGTNYSLQDSKPCEYCTTLMSYTLQDMHETSKAHEGYTKRYILWQMKWTKKSKRHEEMFTTSEIWQLTCSIRHFTDFATARLKIEDAIQIKTHWLFRREVIPGALNWYWIIKAVSSMQQNTITSS